MSYEGVLTDAPQRISAPLLEEDEPEVELPSGIRRLCDSKGFRKDSIDAATTPTTCTGGFSPASGCHTSSVTSFTSPFSDTAVDIANPTTASNVMTFAKTVDKNFAKIYERRIQAMVKEEQKKSIRRVAKW